MLFPFVDDVYTIHTMDLPSFDKIWLFTDMETFTFEVHACKEANIFLSTTPFHKTDGLHIKIGAKDNQVISITEGENLLGEKQTPNVLSCDRYRWFWLSWDDNVVRVGEGSTVKTGELIAVEYNTAEMKAFSISTVDNVEGFWRFTKSEGIQLTYFVVRTHFYPCPKCYS